MSQIATPTNTVVLEPNGHHLHIDASAIDALGGDILGRVIRSGADSEHGYAVDKATQSLLRRPNGARFPNAGMLPTLRFLAEQRNLQLQVREFPPRRHFDLPDSLDQSRFPGMIDFVCRHQRGLIRFNPGVEKEWIIGDLAYAFPGRRIIVLGNHLAELKRLIEPLSRRFPGTQRIDGKHPIVVQGDEPMPRIVLSTFVEAVKADFATADLVVLLDARHCVHQIAITALSAMDAGFRLFGMQARERAPSPSECDTMMATFGPQTYDVVGVRKTSRPVHVAWIDQRYPRIDLKPSDQKFFEQCYWRNKSRNKKIARAASLFRNRDMAKIEERYPPIADWLNQIGDRDLHITILVERPRHAAQLAKHLEDWSIVTGDVRLDLMPRAFRRRANQLVDGWEGGRRQIVLADAARNLDASRTGIVIWAGGGPHIDGIPLRWLECNESEIRPLLIVDFKDQFNFEAAKFARQRGWEYSFDRDVFPVHVSPANGRIALFLSIRPRSAEA